MNWTNGTPAEPGVYVASLHRSAETRRHWDGMLWSAPWDPTMYDDDDLDHAHFVARRCALTVGESQQGVEWLTGRLDATPAALAQVFGLKAGECDDMDSMLWAGKAEPRYAHG